MNIPFPSMQKRFKKNFNLEASLGGHIAFSPEVETELANFVKKILNIFYGCTVTIKKQE